MQMTITSEENPGTSSSRHRAGRLVIMVTGIFGAVSAGASPAALLTTSDDASPALATAPLAPSLTTVIVDGSIYAPPKLFATYSAALGRPVTREGARAI